MDDKVAIITELLKMVEANEWQTRHAAENRYCPYCANINDDWEDQIEHHFGCPYVTVTMRARTILGQEA